MRRSNVVDIKLGERGRYFQVNRPTGSFKPIGQLLMDKTSPCPSASSRLNYVGGVHGRHDISMKGSAPPLANVPDSL